MYVLTEITLLFICLAVAIVAAGFMFWVVAGLIDRFME